MRTDVWLNESDVWFESISNSPALPERCDAKVIRYGFELPPTFSKLATTPALRSLILATKSCNESSPSSVIVCVDDPLMAIWSVPPNDCSTPFPRIPSS